ncbi:FecR family protein [Pararcticibacter amylolyticus]|uniref:Iron dicitrate transport regulator FecR n=1 Tax=Pararcticibacter amylolyticus TaxID=2173175 RepID=A0A2U2PJ97_9SPHI|nr:FecR family protein [Pararcticibacter amylolyticus]PWG81477.1 iron dicitrate transport regulator FecR [Pararcticibacter amylolyticus]
MMIQRKEAENLLQKYIGGTATEEERALLEAWYAKYEMEGLPEVSEISKRQQAEHIREALIAHSGSAKSMARTVPVWPRMAVAASVVFLLAFGTWIFRNKQETPQKPRKSIAGDVAPGSDKAVLTLGNGTQMNISGARSGLLTRQGNTHINIRSGKELIYNAVKEKTSGEIEYNTLTTPRGGQYALTLPDGTKVWLDAASSITFPVAFTGSTREVKISGQVYFEVAHQRAKPFRVKTGNQVVEVLGTRFNINAYADEPDVKTTLFEGSVKVSDATDKVVLKPGQQAENDDRRISVRDNASMDEAIAWHQGLFRFEDADIKTVMRQLARWYDVDISYEGKVTERRFSGKIYRNISALQVSDILSYKQIRFRIEGKRIIVMP